MRSYQAARRSFSFIEGVARFIVGVGLLAAIGGGGVAVQFVGQNLQPFFVGALGTLPGLAIVLVGYHGVAMAQTGRASVDSAEYGQQALQVARDQLEVSRQALQQGRQMAASYAAQAAKKPATTNGAMAAEHSPNAGVSYDARMSQAAPVAVEDGATQITQSTDQIALPRPGLETTVSELLGEPVEVAGRALVFEDGLYRYGSLTFKSRE